MPVINYPFKTVAFDIFGPLPRTSRGNKCLLTFICLASKYPDAVPLNKVDVETVTEAMCEFFCITSASAELLTDQEQEVTIPGKRLRRRTVHFKTVRNGRMWKRQC